MTRILVTGGLGFIGSNLVDLLVENKEYSVTVIDNLSSNSSSIEYKNKHAIYLIGDVTNLDNLCDDNFDYIIHLAAFARLQTSFLEPRKYLENNINSTLSICEYAREKKSKLIFSSSSTIMHGEKKNPYTFSKKLCEDIIQTMSNLFDLKYVICRFYNVYGNREPSDKRESTVVQKFITKYNNSEPLTIVGDGTQSRDFTNVLDITEGINSIIKNDSIENEIIHLGTSKSITILDLCSIFPESKVKYIPSRKGEGNQTIAPLLENNIKFTWSAKVNLEEYIMKKIIKK